MRTPSPGATVCIFVCMARLNEYVPDDLVESLEARTTGARHDDVLDAIDVARNDFGA